MVIDKRGVLDEAKLASIDVWRDVWKNLKKPSLHVENERLTNRGIHSKISGKGYFLNKQGRGVGVSLKNSRNLSPAHTYANDDDEKHIVTCYTLILEMTSTARFDLYFHAIKEIGDNVLTFFSRSTVYHYYLEHNSFSH